MDAQGMIAVWLHVAPQHEDEFNDWYELEHVDQVVALPGFVSGRRYAADDTVPKYLALYETADEHVEPGPHFQALVASPTPWSRRIRRLYGENRRRNNYRLLYATGPAPAPHAACLLMFQMDVAPGDEAEFNDWYDREHVPLLAAVPGCLRARRFVAVSGAPRYMAAYEFLSPAVLESPGWKAARDTEWTARMRSRFVNPLRTVYRLVR